MNLKEIITKTDIKTYITYCLGFIITFVAGIIFSNLSLIFFCGIICGIGFIILIYYKLEWGIGLLIASMLFEQSIVMAEISLTKIITLPIIFIAIVKILLKHKRLHINNTMDSIIIILFFWMSLSIFYAKYLDKTLQSFLTYLQLIFIYLVIKSIINDENELKKIIKIIVIFCLGMSIFSIVSIIKDPSALLQSAYQDSDRIVGTSDDPNKFAQSLIFVLPFSLYLFNENKNHLIHSAIFILLILSTFSRGGFLGMAVVLLLSILVLLKNSKKGIIISCGIIIVLACSFMFLDKGNKLSNRYKSIEKRGGSSISIRLDMIYTAIDMGLQHPLTGVGLNNFIENSHLYGNKVNYGRASHNGYLEILATLGIPGFLLLIILIYLSLKNIKTYINIVKRHNLNHNLLMAQFIGISFIGYMTTSFFLALLANKLYWVLLAFSDILFKCSQRFEREKNNNSEQNDLNKLY